MGLRRIVSEQARTEQALGLAESRRLEAEDLVSFMLVDLSAKLCGQELLEEVATKVADYYRSRGATTKRAATLEILAEAQLEHDHGQAAIDNMREAARVREAVVWRDLTDGSLVPYLASRDKLGLFLQHAGRAADARAAFQTAMLEGERIYAAHPSHDARERLCWAHDRLGSSLLEGGDLASARRHHARAAALTDELLLDAPRSVDWHFAVDMHVEYARRMFDTDPGTALAELARGATILAMSPDLDPEMLAKLSSPDGVRAAVARYRSERNDERSALEDDRTRPLAVCNQDNQAYLSAVGHYYMGLAAETDHDVSRGCSELASAVAILEKAAPIERKPNVKAAMTAELAKYRQNLSACSAE
jgi:hypothetical protein